MQSNLGRVEDSFETFERVVKLQPGSSDSHSNLAIALTDQYSYERALKAFSEAIRLNLNSPSAHYHKGQTLLDLRRVDEARSELKAALRTAPNYVAALYLLALVERQANNTPRSLDLLSKVIALKPNHGDGQYLLGQVLLLQGETESAIERWKTLLGIQADHGRALYSLWQVLRESGDAEAEQYEDRLRINGSSVDRAQLLGRLAESAAKGRDWPQAFALLEEALDACGQCAALADLRKQKGLFQCRTGDLQRGKQELEAALKLEPDDPEVLKALQMAGNALRR